MHRILPNTGLQQSLVVSTLKILAIPILLFFFSFQPCRCDPVRILPGEGGVFDLTERIRDISGPRPFKGGNHFQAAIETEDGVFGIIQGHLCQIPRDGVFREDHLFESVGGFTTAGYTIAYREASENREQLLLVNGVGGLYRKEGSNPVTQIIPQSETGEVLFRFGVVKIFGVGDNFLAVDSGGLWRSEDGILWVPETLSQGSDIRFVAANDVTRLSLDDEGSIFRSIQGGPWEEIRERTLGEKPVGLVYSEGHGFVTLYKKNDNTSKLESSLDGDSWVALQAPEGFPSILALDSNHELMVGLTTGLFRLKSGVWVQESSQGGSGQIVVADDFGIRYSLLKFGGSGWGRFELSHASGPENKVWFDEKWWANNDRGDILSWNEGDLPFFFKENSVPINDLPRAQSLLLVNDQLWGVNGGLIKISKGGSWEREVLPINAASIKQLGEKIVVTGFNAQIAVLDENENWEVFDLPADDPPLNFEFVNGQFLFATRSALWWSLDLFEWRKTTTFGGTNTNLLFWQNQLHLVGRSESSFDGRFFKPSGVGQEVWKTPWGLISYSETSTKREISSTTDGVEWRTFPGYLFSQQANLVLDCPKSYDFRSSYLLENSRRFDAVAGSGNRLYGKQGRNVFRIAEGEFEEVVGLNLEIGAFGYTRNADGDEFFTDRSSSGWFRPVGGSTFEEIGFPERPNEVIENAGLWVVRGNNSLSFSTDGRVFQQETVSDSGRVVAMVFFDDELYVSTGDSPDMMRVRNIMGEWRSEVIGVSAPPGGQLFNHNGTLYYASVRVFRGPALLFCRDPAGIWMEVGQLPALPQDVITLPDNSCLFRPLVVSTPGVYVAPSPLGPWKRETGVLIQRLETLGNDVYGLLSSGELVKRDPNALVSATPSEIQVDFVDPVSFKFPPVRPPEGFRHTGWTWDPDQDQSLPPAVIEATFEPVAAIPICEFVIDRDKTASAVGLLVQQVDKDTGSVLRPPIIEAKPGWNFLGWDGEFENLTEDRTVNAIYEQWPTATFVISDTQFGEVSEGDSLQQVRPGLAVVPPTVSSSVPWRFVRWVGTPIDGFTNLREDREYVAEFEFELPPTRFAQPIQAFTRGPSNVTALFRLTDQNDRGLNLPADRISEEGFFEIREAGSLVSRSESFVQVSKFGEADGVIRTVLMIDTTFSVGARLQQIKEAALKIVEDRTPNQLIAVYTFASSVQEVQTFTGDEALLRDKIEGLALRPSSTTNVYRAVIDGVQLWEDKLDFADSLKPEPVERGFMILLSDADDEASEFTIGEALAARGSKQIYAIGLGSSVDPVSLGQIGNAGAFTAAAADLPSVFEKIQKDLLNDVNSFYWLNYVSPKRGARDHQVTVRIPSNPNQGGGAFLTLNFNSDGFDDVLPAVIVNPSVARLEGITEIKLTDPSGQRLDARTRFLISDDDPVYSWTIEDSSIAELREIDNSSYEIVGLNPGTTFLTVTDIVNEPFFSGFYRREIEVTVLSSGVTAPDFSNALVLAGLTGADALPEADPNADGIDNALAFSLGIPLVGDSSGSLERLPVAMGAGQSDAAAMRFSIPDPLPPGVTYYVEKATVLSSDTWEVIARKVGKGQWTGTVSVDALPSGGGAIPMIVTDPRSFAEQSGSFMRLRVKIAE